MLGLSKSETDQLKKNQLEYNLRLSCIINIIEQNMNEKKEEDLSVDFNQEK